jgi:hypothetical protein
MSATVGFELVVSDVGGVITALAASMHSMDVATAGLMIGLLGAYAAWLDRQRRQPRGVQQERDACLRPFDGCGPPAGRIEGTTARSGNEAI